MPILRLRLRRDFQSVIARAVARLPEQSAERRHGLYRRAQAALLAHFRSLDPPLPEVESARQQRLLDDGIGRVEAHYGASVRAHRSLAMQSARLLLTFAEQFANRATGLRTRALDLTLKVTALCLLGDLGMLVAWALYLLVFDYEALFRCESNSFGFC